MELKDLVGSHVLTHVSEGEIKVSEYGTTENCATVTFVLDGKVYTAVENPEGLTGGG
jgi:hypothetical protein